MIDDRLSRSVLVGLFALALAMLYCLPGLYGDGSNFLLNHILSHTYMHADFSRSFANYIAQTPVLLALRAGCQDLNLLVRLHTFGLLAPLLFWFVALAIQRRSPYFWILVAAFCATFLTGGLVIIGEYNFGAALVALAAAILLKSERLSILDAVWLIFSCAVLLKAYPSTAFLAPVLIVLGGLRMYDVSDAHWPRAGLVISLLLLTGATGLAWEAILHPFSQNMLAGATSFRPLLRTPHFIYLAAMAALLLGSVVLGGRKRAAVVALACVLSVAYIVTPRWWNPPYRNYEFRALSALMLFALLCACLFDRIIGRFGASMPLQRAAPVALCCLVAVSTAFVVQLFGFRAWAARFETEVLARRGVVAIERTTAYPSPYVWTWTNPSLSAVLKAAGEGAIIANPADYTEWEPFPVAETPKVDLPKTRPLF